LSNPKFQERVVRREGLKKKGEKKKQTLVPFFIVKRPFFGSKEGSAPATHLELEVGKREKKVCHRMRGGKRKRSVHVRTLQEKCPRGRPARKKRTRCVERGRKKAFISSVEKKGEKRGLNPRTWRELDPKKFARLPLVQDGKVPPS